ncbi:MAG: PLP-dependent transferase, partial [Candidatus Deferrimicrobiaceae bacterium]
PSLGGPESLATQPMTTTHHGLTPEERQKRGITDSMIRFSIGMEAAEDLIDDLNNALENV